MSMREVIGILPAGGRATRISPLPCSKEILPVGVCAMNDGGDVSPKVVSHYLLEKMNRAGICKAYIVLRPGKWDIPTYYNDGAALNMHLAYLMMRLPYGPPFTVDQAYAFVRHAIVAFGFPDILFQPRDAFVRLLERQAATGADVILGVCPTQPPDVPNDRLDIDATGRVRRIAVKSQTTHLVCTWVMAVWTPLFTEFMHAHLAAVLNAGEQLSDSVKGEMIMGDVIAAALNRGIHINTVEFLDEYIDLGTRQGLARIYAAEGADSLR